MPCCAVPRAVPPAVTPTTGDPGICHVLAPPCQAPPPPLLAFLPSLPHSHVPCCVVLCAVLCCADTQITLASVMSWPHPVRPLHLHSLLSFFSCQAWRTHTCPVVLCCADTQITLASVMSWPHPVRPLHLGKEIAKYVAQESASSASGHVHGSRASDTAHAGGSMNCAAPQAVSGQAHGSGVSGHVHGSGALDTHMQA
jgi:hypothetical protein